MKKVLSIFHDKFFLILTLFFISVFQAFAVSSEPPDQSPSPLISEAQWNDMQSKIREASYRIHPDRSKNSDSYIAGNSTQGFSARFHRDEIEVFSRDGSENSGFKLEPVAYGYPGAMRPMPNPKIGVDKNRIEYQRGDLAEWYINDPSGLEQGFTLTKPLPNRGGAPLRLEMRINSALTPKLIDKRTTAFINSSGRTVWTYRKLHVIDAENRVIPAEMEISGKTLALVVQDKEAVYPIYIDPFIVYEKKLNPSYAVMDGNFGSSVDIDANAGLMVIGQDNKEGLDFACVFKEQDDGSWDLLKYLPGPDAAADRFGHHVAVSGNLVAAGDYNGSTYVYEVDNGFLMSELSASKTYSVSIDGDIIGVACRNADSLGAKAYIFERNNWATPVKELLKNVFTDGSGLSVCVKGNLMAVGCDYTRKVDVFRRDEGGTDNWGLLGTAIPPVSSNSDDYFGVSVAVQEDTLNDEHTLIVGARGNNEKADRAGAVFVFEWDGMNTQWNRIKKIMASDAAPDMLFGLTVDLDVDTLVVGCGNGMIWNEIQVSSYAAYVFDRNKGGTDNWGEVKRITVPEVKEGDNFGKFAAVSEDLIIAGMPGDDGILLNSGSAYLFRRDMNGIDNWGKIQKVYPGNNMEEDHFGIGVSVDGDTVVIGAGKQTYDTYVTIFERNLNGSDQWGMVKQIFSPHPDSDGRGNFGREVAINGDLLVVGAEREDTVVATDRGRAYLYGRNHGGDNAWGMITELDPDYQDAYGLFGASVSVFNDMILVGSKEIISNVAYSGSAYIFYRDSDNNGADDWGRIAKITENGQLGDLFGNSVSINNNTAVVGEPLSGSGAAYIYLKDSPAADGWGRVKKLTAPNSISGDSFGASVSVFGAFVLIGSPGDVDGSGGIAYLYGKDQGGAGVWGLIKTFKASDGHAVDKFGGSVSLWVNDDPADPALHDGIIVIGAPGHGQGSDTGKGAAYVYDRNNGGRDAWGEIRKLSPAVAEAGDNFGDSIFTDGNTIVAGAPYDDDFAANSGMGFVYRISRVPYVKSIVRANASPTNSSSVQFAVDFSQTVSGIDTNDFSLSTTGSASGDIVSVSAYEAQSVTVTVGNITGEGRLGLIFEDNDTVVYKGVPVNGSGSGGFQAGDPYDVDRIAPYVVDVNSDDPNGYYNAGDSITVIVRFDDAVNVSPDTQLVIDTGSSETALMNPVLNDGNNELHFTYSIQTGHNSPDLDYAAQTSLTGTLTDALGNIADLTLPVPGASGSLGNNKSIIIDTRPPFPPVINAATPTNDTTPDWSWMSGGGGCWRYRYNLNGAAWSPETTNTFFTPGSPLTSDGSYTLYVQERDLAGNWSASGEFTVLVDTSCANPPDVKGVTPSNLVQPTWTWTSGNMDSAGQYIYSLDGATWSIPIQFDQYRPPVPLSDGPHVLNVREQDQVGNWSATGTHTIVVDTGEPCSEASSPQSVNAAGVSFKITYTAYECFADQVCGPVSTGGGLDRVDLYVKTPDASQYSLVQTDSGATIDGVFYYQVSDSGIYRFYTQAVDKAGNIEPVPGEGHDTLTLYTSDFAGYALLSVGAIYGEEGIASHTYTANMVYRHLINRNFALVSDPVERWNDPLDHIKYYNPYDVQQTGEDDYSDGGTVSYWYAMQETISTWAYEKLSAIPGPFYIVLIDHGAPDTFYLESPDRVYAQELNSWINTLETKLGTGYDFTANPIIIVLGTCYSGSFMDELSKDGRIVVTASAADEPSYRGARDPGGVRDGEFFVSALFNELDYGCNGAGCDLATAFTNATERTEIHTFSGYNSFPAPYFDTAVQHPHLDDNGDGVGSNTLTPGGDGEWANKIYLGTVSQTAAAISVTSAGVGGSGTTCDCDPCPPVVDGTGLLWAEVDDAGLDPNFENMKVWVEIREPGVTLEDGEEIVSQRTVDTISRYLTLNVSEWRFEYDYSGFTAPGRYDLFFYAKYDDGNTVITSPFKHLYVYNDTGIANQPPVPADSGAADIELLFPANDGSMKTIGLLDWTDAVDPDGDDFTYTVYISTSAGFTNPIVKAGLRSSVCTTTESDGLQDGTLYYWKVQAVDEYGACIETPVWSFTADNQNPAVGWIQGHVVDMDTREAIDGASVTVGAVSVQTQSGGYYLGELSPGIYNPSVTASGYTDVYIQGVEILEGRFVMKDFTLESLGVWEYYGNVNGDETVDLTDAIIVLKVLAGVPVTYTNMLAADMDENNVIDLAEAVFILHRVAGIR